MTSVPSSIHRLRLPAPTGWVVPLVAAVGALYPLSAYAVHPLALPVATAAGILLAITLAQPGLGIAVALVLATLNPSLVPVLPWLPAAAWTAMLGVLTLVVHAQSESGAVGRFPPIGVAVIVFLASRFVALLPSPVLTDAVPMLRTNLTGVVLFFVVTTVVRTREQAIWVLNGAVAGLGLVGLQATYQYATGAPSEVGFVTGTGQLVSRVTVGFGSPNQLAGFLVMVLPLAAVASLRRSASALHLVTAVVAVIGIYASYSRAALVVLLAVAIVLMRARHALVLVVLVALVLAAAAPSPLRERFSDVGDGEVELVGRPDFWGAGWNIWLENPALGGGLGSFPRDYPEVPDGEQDFLPDTIFEPPPHAHNLFLNLLAEQGLVGFIAMIVLLARAALAAAALLRSGDHWIRSFGRSFSALLVAFCVHNQFDVTLFETTEIYFWALLGLCSAVLSMSRDSETREEPHRAAKR